MNKEINLPTDQIVDQTHQHEPAGNEPTAKRLFVEPTISVAIDVLEATTFFQAPTIEDSST